MLKVIKVDCYLIKNVAKIPASFYIGGVNPYATYEIDIHSLSHDGDKVTEVGFELARLGLKRQSSAFRKIFFNRKRYLPKDL